MNVVIAGSASLQDEIQKWILYWNAREGYKVVNYPQTIPSEDFEKLYPEVHAQFFKDIADAGVLFIANEKKNGIEGYIGAETFAELAFGLAQNPVYGKNIRLVLAHMPAKEVACHDEIVLWLNLGWIELQEV